MTSFELNINGKKLEVEVDASTPLLWVLRDHFKISWHQIWLWYCSMRCLYCFARWKCNTLVSITYICGWKSGVDYN